MQGVSGCVRVCQGLLLSAPSWHAELLAVLCQNCIVAVSSLCRRSYISSSGLRIVVLFWPFCGVVSHTSNGVRGPCSTLAAAHLCGKLCHMLRGLLHIECSKQQVHGLLSWHAVWPLWMLREEC